MPIARRTITLLAPEVATRGGIQSFMWRIWECIAIAAPDWQVCLGVVNDSTDELRASGRVGRDAVVFGAARSKLRFVLKSLKLPAADFLIVGHVGQAPVALLLKWLGRVRRYAVVLHGLEAWRKVSFLQTLACRHAYAVLTTTTFTAAQFGRLNRLNPEKFRVVPLCADASPKAKSSLVLTGSFRTLIVGRQARSERYKGFSQLIGAVSLLRKNGMDVTLHIVGDGDDQPSLRNEARSLQVADHVVFHGTLDDADLEAAYSSCDVYAMPSRDEGFGIAFLEAMRHAKPCVGAASGGIPDVVVHEGTGLLVPYGDECALAAALSRLHDDPELRAILGAAGRRRLEALFSFEAFCNGYGKLLYEAVDT